MGSGVMGGIVTSAMNVMGGLCRARTRVPIELDGGPPSFVGLDADTSVTELRRRLEDRVNHIGAPSAEVPSHHKCLAALLGSEDTVSPSPVTTVRPFELSKLKVCSSEHETVDLAPLLDTGARRFLEQPELIIKGDDDVDMEDAPDLYTDPALQDPATLLTLIKLLISRGLCCGILDRICSIGVFTVFKQLGMLRLVFDCRLSNLFLLETTKVTFVNDWGYFPYPPPPGTGP